MIDSDSQAAPGPSGRYPVVVRGEQDSDQQDPIGHTGAIHAGTVNGAPGLNGAASAGAGPARPRVVMLVANRYTHDTRVAKEAKSLSDWACEVVILAMTGPDLPIVEVQSDHIMVRRVSLARKAMAPLVLMPLTLLFNRWRGFLEWVMRRGFVNEYLKIAEGELPRKPPVKRARFSLTRWFDTTVERWRTWLETTQPDALYGIVRFFWRVMLGVLRLVRKAYRLSRHVVRSVWARTGRPIRQRLRFKPFLAKLAPPSVQLIGLNYRFARVAIDHQPDVILAHDANTLLAGLIVKRLTGAKLVYDSHELFLERNIGEKSRRKDNLVWAPIERTGILAADASMSVAEGICRHLEKQYAISKPHLIRNVQPYEPPAARSTLLADELGIDRSTPLVIYAGAITINRGIEFMIDSAPYLDDAAYVIMGYAGNPKYLDALRRRAEDLGVVGTKVFFRDAVPMDQVVTYVASCALSIVPTQNICLSYYFESSNKIFHSMMAGVPLVMSDHLEKRLIVERHGVGRLFDETDPRDIARVVNETLADRDELETMHRHCLDAAKHLNWEHEEHRLRLIFADLLSGRVPPVPAAVIHGLNPGGILEHHPFSQAEHADSSPGFSRRQSELNDPL